MDAIDKKLARAIEDEPADACLQGVQADVWGKIRIHREIEQSKSWTRLSFPPAIKVLSLVLILGSCVALSQLSFDRAVEPDLFDLRYFSHQTLATTNLLSLNNQGTLP